MKKLATLIYQHSSHATFITYYIPSFSDNVWKCIHNSKNITNILNQSFLGNCREASASKNASTPSLPPNPPSTRMKLIPILYFIIRSGAHQCKWIAQFNILCLGCCYVQNVLWRTNKSGLAVATGKNPLLVRIHRGQKQLTGQKLQLNFETKNLYLFLLPPFAIFIGECWTGKTRTV